MKRIFPIAFILLVLGLTFYGAMYLNQRAIDTAYNNAINFIQSGFYRRALDQLEIANPNILYEDRFKDDLKRGKLSETYKDTVSLYAYALAQIEYNEEYMSFYSVNEYLNFIPADYSGDLSEEIATFKGNFKVQYDEDIKERARKAEEARIEQEKQEREYIAGLKSKIPYEGMREIYINQTAAGEAKKHDSKYVKGYGSKPGYDYDKYYWYAKNSNDIVLIVECEDGIVTDVTKYFEWVYWTADGMPKFGATKPKTTTKSSSSKKKSDPYNVYDYSDPEDFYYDNYDDFWEYEEAEDYFNEHHG